MELESYDEGVLLYIGVQEKDSVPVNGVIAIIGEKGEAYEHLLNGSNPSTESKADTSKSEEQKLETKEVKKPETEKPKAPEEKIDTSNINATVITMPKMSDTMQEGTISTWLKKSR